MYRVLVIDDEPIIADGISGMLSEYDEEAEIHTCYSSTAALTLMKRYRTDIVITDINMPVIDGIELISMIKKEWKDCRIVVLSGYDKFDYAQQAMNNGASAYLLKGEGNDVIKKAYDQCRQEIEERNRDDRYRVMLQTSYRMALPLLTQKLVKHIILTPIIDSNSVKSDAEKISLPLEVDRPFILIGMRLDEKEDSMGVSSYEVLSNMIAEVFADRIKESFHMFPAVLDNHRISIWLLQKADSELPDAIIKDRITGQIEDLQTFTFETLNVSASFVIEPELYRIEDVFRVSNKLSKILSSRSYFSDRMIITETGFYPQQDRDFDISDITARLKELENLLSMQSWTEFQPKLQILLKELKQHHVREIQFYAYSFMTQMFLDWIIRSDLLEAFHNERSLFLFQQYQNSWDPDSFNEIEKIADWIIRQNTTKGQDAFYGQLIKKIDTFIEMNCTDSSLSLSDIADHAALSPVYLSRLYKNKTGGNISTKIMEARVEKAKVLLDEGKYNISAIIEMVGFNSLAHFSRVFKKVTGISPKQYQNRIS